MCSLFRTRFFGDFTSEKSEEFDKCAAWSFQYTKKYQLRLGNGN